MALSAAKLYLTLQLCADKQNAKTGNLDTESENFIDWLGQEYRFVIALGADGFPRLKQNLPTFSLTFLNLGGRVHSPKHLHLLFGCDFDEKHSVCMEYCRILSQQARKKFKENSLR